MSVTKKVAGLLLGATLLVSQTAGAVLLDFRDSFYSDALGQNEFSATVDGISFTIKAKPANAALWWDSSDGFGIQHGYENDEIEGNETLVVLFHTPVNLQGLLITDLFNEQGYLEKGVYSANTTWNKFYADPAQQAGQSNGELWIDTTYSDVNFMFFQAPGRRIAGQNHEFSLAALQVSAVPVPAALWLFGSGLLALGGLLKRKHSRTA